MTSAGATAQLVALLQFLVGKVVSHPDSVQISRVETPQTDLFYLTVDPNDLGRLLGREGKTVESIRTMVDLAAARHGKSAIVDVIEPERKGGPPGRPHGRGSRGRGPRRRRRARPK
jgi:predicted RNA-binding protein YlqC (UPF0109 family)